MILWMLGCVYVALAVLAYELHRSWREVERLRDLIVSADDHWDESIYIFGDEAKAIRAQRKTRKFSNITDPGVSR